MVGIHNAEISVQNFVMMGSEVLVWRRVQLFPPPILHRLVFFVRYYQVRFACTVIRRTLPGIIMIQCDACNNDDTDDHPLSAASDKNDANDGDGDDNILTTAETFQLNCDRAIDYTSQGFTRSVRYI